METTLGLIGTFALSTGIGLLVGLERERNPAAKAGVRTFALIAILGTLGALLGEAMDSAWPATAGVLAVGTALIAAHLRDPATLREDSGTTTVVAALVVFFLGAINFHGHRVVAVALGVAMTVLLYFKAELEQFSKKLTPQDIRSMLQFAVLSAVILPLLPDRSFGPYDVLNPFNVWLMVVLIAGISLAGYVAWRLTLGRHGLLLTGVLGGVVSSTATTLVYARHVKAGTQTPSSALFVILLANATMLVRVLVLVAIVAPGAVAQAMAVVGPAVLGALAGVLNSWRTAGAAPTDEGDGYRNPTNLLTALSFAAAYAILLLLTAWAADRIGDRGVYGLALISGLTDVDAITLSSLRLLESGTLQQKAALTAVALAVGSNLAVKAALTIGIGGAGLRRPAVLSFALPLAGLVAGIWLLHALA
jgi:uncharacterized membrane protein (DUF4010 family)